MTLLPHNSWNVTAVDRKPYEVPTRCAVPGCGRQADHAHHLWRRSFGTRNSWVCLAFLDDRPIVGNITPLCWQHHQDVTGDAGGHDAKIEFDDLARLFFWALPEPGGWARVGALVFQPPGLTAPAPVERAPEPDIVEELENVASLNGDRPDVQKLLRRAARLLAGKKKLPKLSSRSKKTWTIRVPDDQEDGHEVLESLLQAAAVKLERAEQKSALVRYFTVVEALVFLLQHEVERGE